MTSQERIIIDDLEKLCINILEKQIELDKCIDEWLDEVKETIEFENVSGFIFKKLIKKSEKKFPSWMQDCTCNLYDEKLKYMKCRSHLSKNLNFDYCFDCLGKGISCFWCQNKNKKQKTDSNFSLKKKYSVISNKKKIELFKILNDLEDFEQQRKNLRIKLLECSDTEYPSNQQTCTCGTELAPNKFIRCRKHLSRYFKNCGCFWCNNTDCSKYGC